MSSTGNRRLIRDLAAVGFLMEDRTTARQRLEAQLGEVFARTLSQSLVSGSHHPLMVATDSGRRSRAA